MRIRKRHPLSFSISSSPLSSQISYPDPSLRVAVGREETVEGERGKGRGLHPDGDLPAEPHGHGWKKDRPSDPHLATGKADYPLPNPIHEEQVLKEEEEDDELLESKKIWEDDDAQVHRNKRSEGESITAMPPKKRRSGGGGGGVGNNGVEMGKGNAKVIMGDGHGKRPPRKSPAVLMEGSRCSRVNGRGWRCCQQTLVGYSLCEHHLGKGRLRSMNSVRGPGGQPPLVTSTGRKPKKSSSDQEYLAVDDGTGSAEEKQSSSGGGHDDVDVEELKKPIRPKKIGMVKARSISSLLGETNHPIMSTVVMISSPVLPPPPAG